MEGRFDKHRRTTKDLFRHSIELLSFSRRTSSSMKKTVHILDENPPTGNNEYSSRITNRHKINTCQQTGFTTQRLISLKIEFHLRRYQRRKIGRAKRTTLGHSSSLSSQSVLLSGVSWINALLSNRKEFEWTMNNCSPTKTNNELIYN